MFPIQTVARDLSQSDLGSFEVVDPTACVTIVARESHRESVTDEWQVDHAIPTPGGTASLRGGCPGHLCGCLECIEHGALRDNADGAPHGSVAVERALGATQDFDAIHVPQFYIRLS